jgi:hypothetical protein
MLKEKNLEGARTLFQALLENSFLVEVGAFMMDYHTLCIS